jgi:peptidyl-prolyl cis-trans isomerase C
MMHPDPSHSACRPILTPAAELAVAGVARSNLRSALRARRRALVLAAPRHVAQFLALAARSHVAHFLALGGLIFALAPRPPSGRDVHLTRGQLAALYGAEARRSGGAVEEARQREIDARAIEDEVLYREALRLGLDRGDGIVRQRLIQKVLFLAEDLAGAARPAGEAELRAYHAATRDRWTMPERVRLVHVFAGPARKDELAALRPQVIAADPGDAPPALGEAFPLSRSLAASWSELGADYGPAFADAVFALPEGAWSEPIASKFGLHLVKVLEHAAARPQSFAEARDRLKLAYLVERKEKATRDYIARTFPRYRIDIDGEPITSYLPSGRTVPERPRLED